MVVDAHFCESVSKNPYGGKPNEKQGPKACQEDQRAREVQRKKCKGKGFAAERSEERRVGKECVP